MDADYYNNEENEGEIAFAFMNISDEEVEIKKGEKLGQGIFVEFKTVTNEGNNGKYRCGGFGSTGE